MSLIFVLSERTKCFLKVGLNSWSLNTISRVARCREKFTVWSFFVLYWGDSSAVDYFIYTVAIIVRTCKSVKTFRLGSVGGRSNGSQFVASTDKYGQKGPHWLWSDQYSMSLASNSSYGENYEPITNTELCALECFVLYGSPLCVLYNMGRGYLYRP